MDWEANTSSFSTIDFEGVAAGAYGNATGVVAGVPSVQFVGMTGRLPANELWVVDPTLDPMHDFGTGQVLKGPYYDGTSPGYLQINLPADITSVAIELMSVGGSATEFAFALSTGDQWENIAVEAHPATKFVGATSDVPIASLQIMLTDGAPWSSYPVFDNFRYGAAGIADPPGPGEETPEAATLLLVGSGLIWVWRLRRRNALPAT